MCLYIYEPSVVSASDFGAFHLRFINDSLRELQQRLSQLGNRLLLRYGEAVEVLNEIHASAPFQILWSHEETGNAITYARDKAIASWARQKNIQWREIPQNGVVRRLQNRDGWAGKWQQRMRESITPEPSHIPMPKRLPQIPLQDAVLAANQLDLSDDGQGVVQAGGQRVAELTLESFLAGRGQNYRSEISSPLSGASSCSRLSPYLAWGNISVRKVFQRSSERIGELRNDRGLQNEPSTGVWLKSLSSFQSRLSWHCHFMQKLEDEPQIEFRNMNRGFDGLREAEFSEERFQAWCAGQTGYPMVDACMRALQQTGWINFRMRAMLVSFAAYHLWLHWQRPALHLAKLFVDYEPGIHYSQFQMQSGVTGINTVRIYSPAKQATDQDPNGVFIRRYVPELANLPDAYLAEPHHVTPMEQLMYGVQIGRDYPRPIVDHPTAYRQARDRILAVKGSQRVKQEAVRVYQKHGSRKTPQRERR